jgi:hypothetical protein
MARTAIFARVHGIHGDLIFGPFHLKNSRVALVAAEYLRVKLMTERYVSDALDLIEDGLLKGLHLVAPSALRRRKCPLPVVARAAVPALINSIHGHATHSFLHLEDPHMALFAA